MALLGGDGFGNLVVSFSSNELNSFSSNELNIHKQHKEHKEQRQMC